MAHIKLDFSAFHPLDHWPGTRYCRTLPGGTRNHLALTWMFTRRDQVLRPFKRVLACPFGRHTWQVWYRTGDNATMPVCKYCPADRLPSEHEIDVGRSSPFNDPNTTFEIKGSTDDDD